MGEIKDAPEEAKLFCKEFVDELLKDACFIKTATVRVGGGNSSSKIHVPKEYTGRKATVIIW